MSLGKTHAENICSKTNTGRNKSRSSKGNKEVRQLPYTETRVSLFLTQLDTTTTNSTQRHFMEAKECLESTEDL